MDSWSRKGRIRGLEISHRRPGSVTGKVDDATHVVLLFPRHRVSHFSAPCAEAWQRYDRLTFICDPADSAELQDSANAILDHTPFLCLFFLKIVNEIPTDPKLPDYVVRRIGRDFFDATWKFESRYRDLFRWDFVTGAGEWITQVAKVRLKRLNLIQGQFFGTL